MMAQGARANIESTAVVLKLSIDAATEEEQRRVVRHLQEYVERMGPNLRLNLGCILAFASHYSGPPPEDVMRALIAELGDTCRAATLQVGMEQLVQWAPGEFCRRHVQILRLWWRHVWP